MKNTSKYIPLIAVMVPLLISMFVSHSCANTTQAPTGGPKDSIPPVIVKIDPLPGSCNVDVKGAKFYFTFNEYVKLTNVKNIIVSPPLDKPLKYKMSGKTLILSSESELQPNTTYTFDFNEAITDNNEGNPYAGYTYAFSTGEVLDSMAITGIVQDCSTLAPVKGATVLLYKNHADSAVLKEKPYATAKTDDWGFFSIRNIQDTLYRIYAIKEETSDLIYNPDTEQIAFIDSIIRPKIVVNDSIPELMRYSMKDTLACQARKGEYELLLFREADSRQVIKSSGRIDERSGYVSFTAPMAHIDTMWINGISPDRLITQFNKDRDSLELWINDRRRMPDTLHLFVNYRKTDSTGVKNPFTEEVKLINPNPRDRKNQQKTEISHADTICAVTMDVDPKKVEQDGVSITFGKPIVSADFDRIKLVSISPKQVEKEEEFSISRDENELRKYIVMPEMSYQDGFEYELRVPGRIFMDINGFRNDSTGVKISLPNDPKLSSLTLEMANAEGAYIVDLMDSNKSNVIRSYNISKDCTLEFPYLSVGSYVVRIIEDKNNNTYVDTGSLLEHKMPEKVRYYKQEDMELIDIPEASEVVQTIYLDKMFND